MVSKGDHVLRELLPFTALVMVECTNVGTSTLFKAASSKGSLDYHVFIAYSYAISTLVLIPLAFFFHRKSVLPPFNFTLVGRFLLLAVLGSSCQFLGYRGIEYSSPTLGSAMSNLTPASTFAFAIIFRMEKLVLRKLSSQAKLMGTAVSISGAIVVILYKGPTVIRSSSPAVVLNEAASSSSESNWVIGGGLLAADYLLVSIWYIFQAQTMKQYPAEFLVVLLYNLGCTIVSAPVCLFLQPNLDAWKIKSSVALAAILYSGIIGSSFGIVVHTWGLHIKGPLYVALFRPLSIAIAAVMGVIFLQDSLYLGSVVGAILISFGFYVVMWGKAQENVVDDVRICNVESVSSTSSSSENIVPLLKGYNIDEQQIQRECV